MNVQGNVSVLLICCVSAAVSYADPFLIAREIERDLAALELQGMDGRAAINRMMAEGYRCGLEEGTALAPGLPAPASVVCSAELSQRETECHTLDVTMLLAWDEAEESRSVLFRRLAASPVEDLHAFCRVPPLLPQTFLTEKKAAESELSQKLAQLVKVGVDAESAFASLLVDGFKCGIQLSREPIANPHELPATRVHCTRLPSSTANCYEEDALLDVAWRDPSAPIARLIEQLGAARIEGIRAVCGLPRIEGNSVA